MARGAALAHGVERPIGTGAWVNDRGTKSRFPRQYTANSEREPAAAIPSRGDSWLQTGENVGTMLTLA
jgi:hypothetical protein